MIKECPLRISTALKVSTTTTCIGAWIVLKKFMGNACHEKNYAWITSLFCTKVHFSFDSIFHELRTIIFIQISKCAPSMKQSLLSFMDSEPMKDWCVWTEGAKMPHKQGRSRFWLVKCLVPSPPPTVALIPHFYLLPNVQTHSFSQWLFPEQLFQTHPFLWMQCSEGFP